MTRPRIFAVWACCVLVAPALLVSCGGDSGGDGDGGTDPVLVDAVAVTPDDPSIEVGATVQLDATPLDESGDPLNRPVTWTTANASVASVSGSGLVTGVASGSTSVRATSEGVTGSVTVTVTPRPVASVLVAPDSVEVAIGATAQLTATTLSASSDTLTGRVIAWTSGNTAVATVSASGLVTGADGGTAVITATSEGVSGSATVVVPEPEPSSVVIDSVSPAVVVEGGSASIHGSGFAATVAGNSVTIDGVSAAITAATETRLDVTVPATGCAPARSVAFEVSAGGSTSAAFDHALEPASSFALAVGEQAILRSPDALCLQFATAAGSEAYVVGVQSTSTSGAAVTPMTLAASAAAAGGAPLASFASRAPTTASTIEPEASPRVRRLLRHRDAELELRARERELLAGLVRLRAERAAGPLSPSAMAVPPDVAVGDTVQLRVPDVSAVDLCGTFFTVDAVVRVIGSAGVWLTDVTNPTGGYSDADLQALSDMFDQEIYATDVAYLGAPTDLDGNGRVAILTTRRVNATQGLLGFVFSGDLFPTSSCAASNEAEIYYGIAPDPAGDFGAVYPLLNARLDAPALIAHEFAHILQNANANHLREVWEAEGQATFIEEVVGFSSQGRSAGNEYGFDVAFNDPATDSISWYEGHFVGLATYYGWPGSTDPQIEGTPEQCSWLVRPPNGPCINEGRLVYDVPKSLLRYISDQFGPGHPGGEQGLHQDLLATTAAGFDAIEAVTGLPIETVLARWAAALYVDGRFATLDPTLETSTWDLFDVFAPLVANAQLTPGARAFGTFSDNFSVRGGSTAYFTISGAGRPAVAVEARTQSGAAVPSFMQLWVVRVQ